MDGNLGLPFSAIHFPACFFPDSTCQRPERLSNFVAMEPSQFSQYLAVLMLFVLALAAPGGMILLSQLLGKRDRSSAIKDTAYEFGMIPVGQGISRLSVRFYLVAMLFILFD